LGDRRFALLRVDAMDDAQRRVAEAIWNGPRGRESTAGGAGAELGEVRGPFNALLRSPELALRLQGVGESVRFHTSLSPALNELAILVTARHWTAQFEWYAHRELALGAGLDPAIPDSIAVGARPPALDRDQAAVYDFASELLRTGGVSDAAFAAADEALTERGVVDLVGVVGYYTLVSLVLNVDRYPLPDGVDPPLQPL
jgi:4-carboxymuconolactone decarboxylase